MQAKSIKGKSTEEIRSALRHSMADGFRPTLAVVFVPGEKYTAGVSEVLDKNGITIFGASSFGQFIDQDFDNESIVALLLEVRPEYYRLEFRETGSDTTGAIARSIGKAGKAVFNRPAFIVSSGGIKTDGEEIVKGIEEMTGSETPIFGGLAASDFETMQTFIFTNGKWTDDGLIALVLDNDKIAVQGLATGGSQPIGTYHTITSSNGNEVLTIDDQPALDMVLRYSGKDMNALKKESDLLGIARMFQLQVQRENRTPVTRTPILANFTDKSVVFTGRVPQGSKVKFCTLPGFEVVENVIRDFSEYRKNVSGADAMILFSCQGREVAFGPWMQEEIDRMKGLWNSPMIGLFSFGEIGRGVEGRTEFYNMTCSLALLNEVI